MRRKKIRELTPPERALSYEVFCELAADTISEAYGGSLRGWNLVACLTAPIPGIVAISFFISLADPNPETWQWTWAFVFAAITVWIFSYPMATGFRGMKRYNEVVRLSKLWARRVEQGQVPRWKSEVDTFVPPPGAPPWPDPALLARADEITEKYGTTRNPVHSKFRRVTNWIAWTLLALFVLAIILAAIFLA